MARSDFKTVRLPLVAYERLEAYKTENSFVSMSQCLSAIIFSLKPVEFAQKPAPTTGEEA